jgi:hypothetical protein
MPTMNLIEENSFSFAKLLVEIARGGIDFALVGGLAVGLNGYPRATLDVDVLVSADEANIERLLTVLRSWGEGWARELSVSDFTTEEGCIRLQEDFELDIFTLMKGRSLDYFRPRLHYLETEGQRIPYLDAKDLIELKQSSVREKDQLDVLALRRILELNSPAP